MNKTQNRLKILMLIPELGYGGAEKSFIRLANYLNNYHNVTIAVFRNKYQIDGYSSERDEIDINIYEIDDKKLNTVNRWKNRFTKLKELKNKNDVCISFLTGTNILNAVTPSKCKVITSMRGSRIYDPNMSAFQKSIYSKLIDPLTYLLSVKVVSISKGLTYEISKLFFFKSKFETIEVFIDPDRYRTLANEEINHEHLNFFNNPVITTTGRLSKEKGFESLIKIFSKVQEKIVNAKLLIIGDGPYKNELIKTCDKFNLIYSDNIDNNSSVIFYGFDKNPLKFYKHSKCFVLSSLTEGFSNALLESLQANKISISVNSPWGPRDILSKKYFSKKAFPSNMVEKVEYGYLMPKIDEIKYEKVWTDFLIKVLSNKIENIHSEERVLDFKEDLVANKWLLMIEKLVNK